MTELEAVNMLLRSIGSGAVAALTVGHPDIANAIACLNRVSRKVQKTGWWFNMDWNVVLQPNPVDNLILLDDSYSTLQCVNAMLVKRSGKLYDTYNKTFLFTNDVQVISAVRILEWDDLPESAQDAILYQAAVEFVRDELEDPNKQKELQGEAIATRITLDKEELATLQHNRYQNGRVARARGGVKPYGMNSRQGRFSGDPDR